MGSDRDWADDPAIPDEEFLYRGIVRFQVVADRPSSSAFKTRRSAGDPHVSVDRGSKCRPQETLDRLPQSAGIAQLQAGTARALRPDVAGVASDPLPENAAHALILRSTSATEGSWGRTARILALACTWAIPPRDLP
jgi:hypothetical protein